MRISDWSSDVCSSDLDLARPARDQRPRLGNQIGEGPARLGAARIGDDAIGAEFVAAFLHGQEGGGALAAGAFRQRAELAFERHVEVDRLLAALGAPARWRIRSSPCPSPVATALDRKSTRLNSSH